MSKQIMVLKGLIANSDFQTTVLPHLKSEYFESKSEQVVLDLIVKFIEKYNKSPSVDSLLIELSGKRLNESTHDEAKALLQNIDGPWNHELDWAINEAEQFCRDAAFNCALTLGIDVMENPTKNQDVDLPKVFSDALSIAFDSKIGHDYFESADDQYLFYTSPESKIPFHLNAFNKATRQGLTKKTLNIFMSSKTGGFKTGLMCDMAAAYMIAGYDVLYVTLEMSENKIRERIDANLLDIVIEDLPKLELGSYRKKIKSVQDRTPGRLVIREYPAACAHVGHIRFLLKELRQKKNFRPTILFVDYLNLMSSQRLKSTDAGNTYKWVKTIAEELRGLAQEFDLIAWSATQSGRQGVKAGEAIDLDDVSESYGLPATVDLMWAVITNDTLDKEKLIVIKQLKNRYAPIDIIPIFELRVDKDRMKVFDRNDQAANSKPHLRPSEKIHDKTLSIPSLSAASMDAASKFDGWSFDD